jgi:hypothetical protein
VEDREAANDRRLAGIDEDRPRCGRVHFEQRGLAQPGFDVLEVDRHPVLGEHQPGEPGSGVEPVLQKAWHVLVSILGARRQIGLEAARP